jgi:putative NADH-flavin reductase
MRAHRRRLIAGLLRSGLAMVFAGGLMMLPATFATTAAAATATAAAGKPLHITVYGGTGRIGSRIVNEALERGHIVTVVVREQGELAAREHLHIVQGDALNRSAVAAQIKGQDVVISAIGGGASQGPDFYTRVAQSYVSALRSLGASAPRLIVIGGAASLEVSPGKLLLDTMPNVDPNSDMVTHKHALDYFRTVTDVAWTFVSPSMQIDPGTRTGKFRLGGDQLLTGADGHSRISMEDFAVAVIDEAEHPTHLRKRFTVGY